MLRISDSRIMQYAIKEQRAIVTINEFHFEKLARREVTHPGIVAIPSGGSRDEQFEYIMAAAEWARAHPDAMAALSDSIVSVDDERNVLSRIVCATPAVMLQMPIKGRA
jgi:hypothetical protein